MATTFTLKQGEQKNLQMTLKTAAGVVIDLTGCTFELTCRSSSDSLQFTVLDAAFDKTQAATGIIEVTLTEANLTRSVGKYSCELKTTFPAPNSQIDKSDTFYLNLVDSLSVDV